MDNALSLVEIARTMKGLGEIQEIGTLQKDLETLATMVYQCGLDLSLAEYDKLTDYERFYFLVKDSTSENIALHIRVSQPNQSILVLG